MQKDLTKIDFAKSRTEFAADFDRARAAFILELRKKIKVKGWLNRLVYWLTKEPFLN